MSASQQRELYRSDAFEQRRIAEVSGSSENAAEFALQRDIAGAAFKAINSIGEKPILLGDHRAWRNCAADMAELVVIALAQIEGVK